MTTQTPATA